MGTLHGSWILEQNSSYLFIWGEIWRTRETSVQNTTTQAVLPHPLAMNPEELLSFCQTHQLALAKFWSGNLHQAIPTRQITQVITLPSKVSSSGQIIAPILSQQMESTNDASLQRWEVTGFYLQPEEAIGFLGALPLNSFSLQESYLGDDLSYWTQVYRWSLSLIVRSKFLPQVSIQSSEAVCSSWQPLLDSTIDQQRWAKFARLMPPICGAYQMQSNAEQENNRPELTIEPQELLLGFLHGVLDAQLRTWLDWNSKLAKDETLKQWLKALSESSPCFVAQPKQAQRLRTALENWTLPIQDYLTDQLLAQIGQSLFRVCFVLQPPTPQETEQEQFDWKLQYYLHSVDEPEFLVDAATIWLHGQEKLLYRGRTLDKPQETLLRGLGLASRFYAPIKDSLEQACPISCSLDPIQVYEFIRASAWQLQDKGLAVILPPGLAAGTGERRLGVKIKAQVTSKKNERLSLQTLLKYKLELAVGEQSLSKADFERMLAQRSPLVQINGEWLALQPADVKAAQEILSTSGNQQDLTVEDALRLSTGDNQNIAKLPVVSFQAAGILKELISNLTNNQAVEPIETPEDFRGELRPYQSRGVGWLAFLERWGLGACLADDMGLGKTPQLIAFLLNLKAQEALTQPALVVCPTSVLGNWEREFAKFAPTLKTLIHHGDKRAKGKTFANKTKKCDVILTSYPLVHRDEKTLAAVNWLGVVLDEAQNIKNPQAKQSQAVRRLKAGFRIALTGTPIENRLSELWSILDFLNPGFLGTKQFFQRRFAIPIEKYGDRDSLLTLRSLVQPFILRRLKTDKNIIADLPQKQEMNVFCGLSPQQATLYQQLVDESLGKIEEAEGIQRHGLILTLLMKLKQVCNHPAHYLKKKKLDSAAHSGKLLRLEEMLEELVAEGDRALIFTQFSEWGKLLKPYLETKLGGEALFLYGATRRQQREEMVDRFQNDPNGPRIFILSIKAGGTGLNLTRANHVFHVDRWWNPAVENQATDRAFRIGQKRNVQVHKFICTGTLEERINDIIESKKQLAEQTVDAGENWLTKFDTNQLRNLLLLDRDAIIDEE